MSGSRSKTPIPGTPQYAAWKASQPGGGRGPNSAANVPPKSVTSHYDKNFARTVTSLTQKIRAAKKNQRPDLQQKYERQLQGMYQSAEAETARKQAAFDKAFEVERQHKIASSEKTAQSRAVQERVAYDQFVIAQESQNRQQQIIAQQQQREQVKQKIEAAGYDASKLKQATPRYNPKPTANEEQRAYARQQVAIPVDRAPVKITGKGSTDRNLTPLTPEGTPSVPGPGGTPDAGRVIKVKLSDGISTRDGTTQNVQRPRTPEYQGPQLIRGIDFFKSEQGAPIGKAFEEAGGYLFAPFTNIAVDIENLGRDENDQKPRTDTILDKAIEAGYVYIKPVAKDALSNLGLTEPANKRNKREAAAAFDAFTQWATENPKQAIITAQGEIIFGAATLGVGKVAQSVYNVAKATKGLNVVADFVKKIQMPRINVKLTPPDLPVIINKPTKKIFNLDDYDLRYHGTSKANAESILKEGPKQDIPFWMTKDQSRAEQFGDTVLRVYTKKGNAKPEIIKGLGKTYESSPQFADPLIKVVGYDVGGEGLVKTGVKVRALGSELFELESSNPKASKFVLYSTKTNQLIVIEKNKVISTPQKFRLRTNPEDILLEEEKKFNLVQNAPGIFETAGKPSAEFSKALKSQSLDEFGRIRSFNVKDVDKNPKEFGRFLFGEGSASSIPPAKPIVDIGLAETKSFGAIASSISKKAPTAAGKVSEPGGREFIQTKPGESFVKIIKPSKVEYDDIIPKGRAEVFKPFKETKTKITTEKPDTGAGTYSISKFVTEIFKSKRPTSTFVTDIQKNIRFQDPFSKVGAKIKGKKLRNFKDDIPTPSETLLPGKPGAQLTAKQTREAIKKDFIKDVSLQESKSDLSGVLPGFAYASKGVQQYSEVIVYPPNTDVPGLDNVKGLKESFLLTPTAKESFGFKEDLEINLQVIPEKIAPGRTKSNIGLKSFSDTLIDVDTAITPIGKTSIKTVPVQKTKEIIDLGFEDKLDIKLETPEKTITRTPTKLITPQKLFFPPPPEKPGITFFPPIPGQIPGLPGADRTGEIYTPKRRAGKKFFAWNVDVNAIGFLPGPEQRVGVSTKVFRDLDKVQANYDLIKMGKTPKQKQSKEDKKKKKKKKGKKFDEFKITMPDLNIKI